MNDKDRLIQILGNQIVIMHALKRMLPMREVVAELSDGSLSAQLKRDTGMIETLERGIERSTNLMPLYGEGEEPEYHGEGTA